MTSDPRKPVLDLLQRHATLPLDDHEATMTAAMIEFVESHRDCAERSLEVGHLTGSAWIVDAARRRTLLTHHRKLEKWLQLGGHADGDLDLLAVALTETTEESGLTRIRPVSRHLFDVDRHQIPARKTDPEHWHYDLRFMIEADPDDPILISAESNDLGWVEIDRMAHYNPEESMMRMARKTLANFQF